MIGCYFDRFHAAWDADELAWFEALIEQEDVDILGWALGTIAVPVAFDGAMMTRMRVLDYIDVTQ